MTWNRRCGSHAVTARRARAAILRRNLSWQNVRRGSRRGAFSSRHMIAVEAADRSGSACSVMAACTRRTFGAACWNPGQMAAAFGHKRRRRRNLPVDHQTKSQEQAQQYGQDRHGGSLTRTAAPEGKSRLTKEHQASAALPWARESGRRMSGLFGYCSGWMLLMLVTVPSIAPVRVSSNVTGSPGRIPERSTPGAANVIVIGGHS